MEEDRRDFWFFPVPRDLAKGNIGLRVRGILGRPRNQATGVFVFPKNGTQSEPRDRWEREEWSKEIEKNVNRHRDPGKECNVGKPPLCSPYIETLVHEKDTIVIIVKLDLDTMRRYLENNESSGKMERLATRIFLANRVESANDTDSGFSGQYERAYKLLLQSYSSVGIGERNLLNIGSRSINRFLKSTEKSLYGRYGDGEEQFDYSRIGYDVAVNSISKMIELKLLGEDDRGKAGPVLSAMIKNFYNLNLESVGEATAEVMSYTATQKTGGMIANGEKILCDNGIISEDMCEKMNNFMESTKGKLSIGAFVGFGRKLSKRLFEDGKGNIWKASLNAAYFSFAKLLEIAADEYGPKIIGDRFYGGIKTLSNLPLNVIGAGITAWRAGKVTMRAYNLWKSSHWLRLVGFGISTVSSTFLNPWYITLNSVSNAVSGALEYSETCRRDNMPVDTVGFIHSMLSYRENDSFLDLSLQGTIGAVQSVLEGVGNLIGL
ncbi:MAG: hypothetical protein LBB24_01225 [Rickettsiales bacterium]|jgi:hypothetical protein|nr:hypothetical protein [Rickettsiales bacterium]